MTLSVPPETFDLKHVGALVCVPRTRMLLGAFWRPKLVQMKRL